MEESSSMHRARENVKGVLTGVLKDLNKCFDIYSEYPSFNYPCISFSREDEENQTDSLWAHIYNEMYQNKHVSLRTLMDRYREYESFNQQILDCFSKGKHLPRSIREAKSQLDNRALKKGNKYKIKSILK